ncbi:MAG: asparagine synthase (glutamine-hydrolyzing), partial [Planctomycetota bacterium]
MCGIAAVLLGPDRARLGNDETRALLEPMTRALEHRGPDGEAFFYGERAALGHRRLAILDLVTGDQPIASADGRIQVCFNGEIYNHKELRRELEGRGHRFRTRSDTEVLVHGFLEWGEALPARLSGMFAFFAHDTTSGRTLCARDPLGKKPLYYTLRDGLLLLASEVKACLALPGMPRRIDGKALRELLALRYVPGPGTLLEGYFELPPGTQALHEPGQEIRPRTYWTPGFDRASGGTPGEAARELRELFARCVTDRLEADVPLGAFLSGGVDSSGVVAAMSRSSPVKAVTVGFAESAYDELPHARAFASRFALELHEEVLRPAPVDDLWHLAGIFDLPLTDSSIWPTWLVCKAARRHVKVALSGDGADENFAGYRRYRFDLLEQRLRRFVSGGLARLLARVLPKGDWLPRPLRLKRTLENLTHDPATAYFRSVSALLPEEVDAMLLPEVGEGADPFEKLREV